MSALLSHLPPPPRGKTGWPWTVESDPLPPTMPDGKEWPKISIVTPSYNQGQFIEETIRSVLLQSYPNLEYIIIDGKSTDESVEIIKKYEPWLTYWVSEKDRGQSDALMKGFRLATGELYAWLNSDDYYLPAALNIFSHAYVKNSGAGLIYSDYYFEIQAKNVGDMVSTGSFAKKILKPKSLSVINTDSFRCYNPLGQPSCFFSSDVFWKVDGLNEALHYSMDYDLWIKIFRSDKHKIHVGKFTSALRLQDQSKTCTTKVGFSQENVLLMQRYFGWESFQESALTLCKDIAIENNTTDSSEVIEVCRKGLAAKNSEEIKRFFFSRDFMVIAKIGCAEKVWGDLLVDYESKKYFHRLRLVTQYLRFSPYARVSGGRLGLMVKAILPVSIRTQLKRLFCQGPLTVGIK